MLPSGNKHCWLKHSGQSSYSHRHSNLILLLWFCRCVHHPQAIYNSVALFKPILKCIFKHLFQDECIALSWNSLLGNCVKVPAAPLPGISGSSTRSNKSNWQRSYGRRGNQLGVHILVTAVVTHAGWLGCLNRGLFFFFFFPKIWLYISLPLLT